MLFVLVKSCATTMFATKISLAHTHTHTHTQTDTHTQRERLHTHTQTTTTTSLPPQYPNYAQMALVRVTEGPRLGQRLVVVVTVTRLVCETAGIG